MDGGSLGELVAFCRRAFYYGLGVKELGVGWFKVNVWVGVCVLLWIRSVRVGGGVM